MNDPKDETLLARWLSGELTEAERKELAESMDLEELEHKLKLVDQLDVPEFSAERMWEERGAAILATEKTVLTKEPARRIRMWPMAAVAAALVVLALGIFWWMAGSGPSLQSGYGERLAQNWEDGSRATLNANSTLQWNADWSAKRRVTLQGEAYFSVSKGQPFSVQTNLGKIEVLGTQFNVRARDGRLVVFCYEGKVRVSDGGAEKVLIAGQGLRLVDGKWEDNPPAASEPSWMTGRSTFKKEPLANVLEELKRQYELNLELDTSIENRIYTGQFPHDDINKALQLICEPMGLSYERQGNQKVLIY